MTRNDHLAARLAVRGWRRSMGSMQDLRGPDVLEARVLRSVVTGAPRAGHRRRRGPGDDLDGAWLRLSPRIRAALIMLHFEEIDPRHVADVLECSDATLASLRSRGLGALMPHLREEDRLQSWLAERAESAPAPPPESVSVRRSVNRRRMVTVAGATLMALLLTAGAVAGTRIAVDRAAKPPSDSVREDAVRVNPQLRRRIEDLKSACPDPRRLGPLPKNAARDAADVAVRFNKALVLDDEPTVRALSEPTAEPTYGAWASTRSHRGVTVTSASSIDPEDLFTIACGRDITRRSLRVVMHDRNGITSRGLAFFYLAHTDDGWRVWAADEPGA
jgi:hypothetical protein